MSCGSGGALVTGCELWQVPTHVGATAVMPKDIGLRLERMQRARADEIPTLAVFVGSWSLACEQWKTWLRSRERSALCLVLDETRDDLVNQLGRALTNGRRAAREIALFVAAHTDELPADVEARLATLSEPERIALFDRLSSASRRPHVVEFARAWLAGAGELPTMNGVDAVVASLELRPQTAWPGVLISSVRLDSVLALVMPLSERLPQLPLAVAVERAELERFLADHRQDRIAVVLREGLVELDQDATSNAFESNAHVQQLRAEIVAIHRVHPLDASMLDRARSLAERLLFVALESHPETRGRFELNVLMPFCFGSGAAEIDLFSRLDRIAIEIDGYHHFVDAQAYRRDRRKDSLMQRHGLFVLRFLAQDVGSCLDEIMRRIIDTMHRPGTGLST